MATDIHIHVEYQKLSRRGKLHWVHANERWGEDRRYLMFGILAGARTDVEPLFPPRGMPEGLSPQTAWIHKDWGEDAHTESWLNTQEFGMCLEAIKSVYKERFPEEDSEELLQDYNRIYRYMKDSDDEGEPARIIFWFDN